MAAVVAAAFAAVWLAVDTAVERSQAARDSFNELTGKIVDSFKWMGDYIQGFVNDTLELFGGWWAENGEDIERTLAKWGQVFLDVANAIIDFFSPAIKGVFGWIKDVVIGTLGYLLDGLKYVFKVLEAIADICNGDFRRAFILIDNAIATVTESLAGMAKWLANLLRSIPVLSGFFENDAKSLDNLAASMDKYAGSLRAGTSAAQSQLTVEEKLEAQRAAAFKDEQARQAEKDERRPGSRRAWPRTRRSSAPPRRKPAESSAI